ncbi:MAG: site-specific DNA-methyltransferase [Planctomycetes bacterium]|nr:site-specific DNA-methyltransferase [Planctomycetota bacterium]
MEKESIDLIYIDPPFFSNRHYEIIWGDEAEIRSFEDRWEGGINVYIDWMKQRVIELHRVLKPTGSFYLHCDWHAGHYLKVMCDEVFGYKNLLNEIIWWYHDPAGTVRDRFKKKHDTIFFYSKKVDAHNFNLDAVRTPYKEGTVRQAKHKTISFGRITKTHPLGKVPEDVWEIPFINSQAKERLGYPTQKPEALLERIIKASSNKGDIVLDAFCGCGTALAVAGMLGRHWIGIDISPSAVALVKNRLKKIGVGEEEFDLIGMPKRVEDLRRFKPFEFQYWVVTEMHGTPAPRKSGDMGIDGLSFMEHAPIQVKQSEGVGRNVIDNFETALRRYYKEQTSNMKGYIVAFSFGKGAYEEVARVKKEGIEIELVTVQDILDKRFVLRQEVKKEIPVQEKELELWQKQE